MSEFSCQVNSVQNTKNSKTYCTYNQPKSRKAAFFNLSAVNEAITIHSVNPTDYKKSGIYPRCITTDLTALIAILLLLNLSASIRWYIRTE
jgi:hypothetical protein